MRLVAILASVLLALGACTNSAEPTSTASATPATTQQTPSAAATPSAAPRKMTFVSEKSAYTSDGNNVYMDVDAPFACVREIAITVRGFTPNGITAVEIKSTDDNSLIKSEKVTNDASGTAHTSLLCTGYNVGGYMLTMKDESSTKWAQVPFASLA